MIPKHCNYVLYILDVVCNVPHASMNGLVPLVGWSIAQVRSQGPRRFGDIMGFLK